MFCLKGVARELKKRFRFVLSFHDAHLPSIVGLCGWCVESDSVEVVGC